MDDKAEYEELLHRDLLDSDEGKCAVRDGRYLSAAIAHPCLNFDLKS